MLINFYSVYVAWRIWTEWNRVQNAETFSIFSFIFIFILLFAHTTYTLVLLQCNPFFNLFVIFNWRNLSFFPLKCYWDLLLFWLLFTFEFVKMYYFLSGLGYKSCICQLVFLQSFRIVILHFQTSSLGQAPRNKT
jgi:hypothetical protein